MIIDTTEGDIVKELKEMNRLLSLIVEELIKIGEKT